MRDLETVRIKSIESRHPHQGKGGSFEDFLPFIKVNDEKLKGKFVEVLKKIYSATRGLWRPGGCYSTEEMEKIVGQLKAEGLLEEMNIVPMNWNSAHFFLVIDFKDALQQLIFDPFGVPTPGKDYHQDENSITPFFGEIKLAPMYHQRIYSAAKPINEQEGYHHFHP